MTPNQPKKLLARGKLVAIVIVYGLTLSIACLVSARPRIRPVNTAPVLQQDSNIHTIKDAGLQFELPRGWKAETEPNGNVFVSFEEGAGNVTFVIEENYQDVISGMKGGLKEKLTDLKFDGEPKEDTHNGMTHISETGSGKMEGVNITWSIDVLKAGKNVTILTFAVEGILKKHIDEYVKFVGSLKTI